MDKGPWAVHMRRLILSHDWTRDVMLMVDGDFKDEEDREKYMDWLVDVLNAAETVTPAHEDKP